MLPSPRHAAILSTGLLALATACAPTGGAEPGAAPAPARPDGRPRAEAHAVSYATGSFSYDVRVSGTAETRGGPVQAQGVGRIRNTAFLTLVASRDDGSPRFRVRADSVAVDGSEPRIPSPGATSPVGSEYEVTVRPTGRTERLTPTSLGCPGRSPLESTMRDAVVPMPMDLTPGRRWVDTVVTVSCRDGIPITTSTEHRYHARGGERRNGMPLMRIRRTGTSRIDGSTVRRGQAVALTGTGTEDASLLVDLARGLLIESEHTVSTELTISGRDGEIPMRQRYTQRIRLLDR